MAWHTHEFSAIIKMLWIFDGHCRCRGHHTEFVHRHFHLCTEDLRLVLEYADAIGEQRDIGRGEFPLSNQVDHQFEASVLESDVVAAVLDNHVGSLGSFESYKITGGPTDVIDDFLESIIMHLIDTLDGARGSCSIEFGVFGCGYKQLVEVVHRFELGLDLGDGVLVDWCAIYGD